MGAPAEEFGPYVVYEQIGLGGMATVHRAESQGIAGFSKQVALKRMLPGVAADASLVRSFIREARLASHLRHANVAQTYDLGKVGETYFIAMELVPGRNLREILKHCAAVVGNMPMPIAMNIVNQICDALDYAHNLCDDSGQPLGIIHRDVSPSNIIVSEGGVVKLIDFGIAKASARGMNTMSGTIKGKFGYMAPEYLMGSLDARADLFALGVIAHELLSNRPLFQGKDDMDTLYRVKDMTIQPPSRFNANVPPELDAIIMTALERDPDQRWQRAQALHTALATETKRLGLVAPNSTVFDWIDWAFQQKKSQFDEQSEPMISISSGTKEMPRATPPRRDTPSPERRDTPSPERRDTPSPERRDTPSPERRDAASPARRDTPPPLRESPAREAATRRQTPFPRDPEVPDEFSALSDSLETVVKTTRPLAKGDEWNGVKEVTVKTPGIAAADDWNVATDATTPASDSIDSKFDSTKLIRPSGQLRAQVPDVELETKRDRNGTVDPNLIDTRRDRSGPAQAARPERVSSRNIIPRNTPRLPPGSTPVEERATIIVPTSSDAIDDDEDQIRTLPPKSTRDGPAHDALVAARSAAPHQPPAPHQARTVMAERSSPMFGAPEVPSGPSMFERPDRPSQPPPVSERSERPSQPPPPLRGDRPSHPPPVFTSYAHPQPGPPTGSGPAATAAPLNRTLQGPGSPPAAAGLPPSSPAMSGARTKVHIPMQRDSDPILDNLSARGERPAARQLGAAPTMVKTQVAPGRRDRSSNFLLAVLVLIAAGGAAAVVYFALPYLT